MFDLYLTPVVLFVLLSAWHDKNCVFRCYRNSANRTDALLNEMRFIIMKISCIIKINKKLKTERTIKNALFL
jgi:hypothetical protein